MNNLQQKIAEEMLLYMKRCAGVLHFRDYAKENQLDLPELYIIIQELKSEKYITDVLEGTTIRLLQKGEEFNSHEDFLRQETIDIATQNPKKKNIKQRIKSILIIIFKNYLWQVLAGITVLIAWVYLHKFFETHTPFHTQ